MAYVIQYGGATLKQNESSSGSSQMIQGVTINKNAPQSDNNQPQSETFTITVNGLTYSNPAGSTTQYVLNGAVWEGAFPTDEYNNLIIKATQDGESDVELFNQSNVRIESQESTNSTDQTSFQLRDFSITFTAFVENTFYGDVKSVSSLTHSYTTQTANNTFIYEIPEESSSSYVENGIYPKINTNSSNGPFYTVTRTIGAVGIKTDDNTSAFDNAYSAVTGVLYRDDLDVRLGVNTNYQKRSVVELDYAQGSYTLTDIFDCYLDGASKTYHEDYTVTVDGDNRSPNSYTTVTIAGNIVGFNTLRIEDPDPPAGYLDTISLLSNQYTNALNGFQNMITTIYDRIPQIYRDQMNPVAVSKQVSKDTTSINYSFSYNTRPVSLVSGALSESLSVEDSYQVKDRAFVPVKDGSAILFDYGSYTLPTRTVSYTVTLPRGGTPSSTFTQINNILDSFDPKHIDSSVNSHVQNDTSTTDISTNTLTYNKTWYYIVE